MSETTTANPLSLLPVLNDDAIRQAMADLDSKLGAWSAAMANAQTALTKTAASLGDREVADADFRQASEASAQSESLPEIPRQDAEPAVPVRESAAQSAVETVVEHEADDAGQREEGVHFQPHVPEQTEVASAETPAAGHQLENDTAETAASGHPTEPDNDDVTLLASLDPEVAKAIRIMRRMSFGQKTLRECLLEYETANATRAVRQQHERESSSFWTRGTRWVKKKKS